MPDLRPCPFCGQVPIILPLDGHGCYISCESDTCPVLLQTRNCDNEEQAAAEWNTRRRKRSHAPPADAIV